MRLLVENNSFTRTTAHPSHSSDNDRIILNLLENQESIRGSCVLVDLAQLRNHLHPNLPLPQKSDYLSFVSRRYSHLLKPGTLDVSHAKMKTALATMFPELGVQVSKVTINKEGTHVFRGSFEDKKLLVVRAPNPSAALETSSFARPFAEITHQYLGDTTHFIARTSTASSHTSDIIAASYYEHGYHPIVALEFKAVKPRVNLQ